MEVGLVRVQLSNLAVLERVGPECFDERPMCGALVEHHDHAHREARPAPADVSRACKAEAAKTFKLLQGMAEFPAAVEVPVELGVRAGASRSATLVLQSASPASS